MKNGRWRAALEESGATETEQGTDRDGVGEWWMRDDASGEGTLPAGARRGVGGQGEKRDKRHRRERGAKSRGNKNERKPVKPKGRRARERESESA